MADTLIEILNDLSLPYGNDDKDWVQFVKDHWTYLHANSDVHIISPAVMQDMRYTPEIYVVSKGLHVSATWIVLYINQIKSANDFIGLTSIKLPTLDALNFLIGEYEKFKARIGEAESELS